MGRLVGRVGTYVAQRTILNQVGGAAQGAAAVSDRGVSRFASSTHRQDTINRSSCSSGNQMFEKDIRA